LNIWKIDFFKFEQAWESETITILVKNKDAKNGPKKETALKEEKVKFMYRKVSFLLLMK